MADKLSSDMQQARSVLSNITKTVENFKSHALPFLPLYAQWKDVSGSFASEAKELELKREMVFAKEVEVEEAFEVKEREIRELGKAVETEMKRIGVECGVLVEKKRGLEVECGELELRVREMRCEVEEFESKWREFEERRRVVEERESGVEERCRVVAERERVVEVKGRVLSLRGKEMRELGEGLEKRAKGIVEGERLLEERRMRLDERCRELERRGREIDERSKEIVEKGRLLESKEALDRKSRVFERMEKELEDRVKEVELRGKEIIEEVRLLKEREKGLEEQVKEIELRGKGNFEEGRLLREREKGLDERVKKVEIKEREIVERIKEVKLREVEIRKLVDDLESKMKELDEFQRKLQLKEKEIEKNAEDFAEHLRLKKDQLVEFHKVLVLKEREITDQQESVNKQLNVLKEKEKEVSSSLKELELKQKKIDEVKNSKRLMSELEEVNGLCATKITEMKALGVLRDTSCDASHQGVVVKEEQVAGPLNGHDLTANQVEEGCNVVGPVEEQVVETCLVPRLKKELNKSNDAADLHAVLIKQCSNVSEKANEIVQQQVVQMKQVKEEPQGENLLVKSAAASSFFTEIQSVFRNNDVKATSTYLIEQAGKDDMWQEKMLGLRDKIPDLIQSLIAEHKHLQAAMCICEFEMKHVYPPDFLLETHLEHTRKRAKEMINEAGATAQVDAANMEISALKDVLRCISDYKLENIYAPATLELRITQLVKEVEERNKPTQSLMGKKSDHVIDPNY